MNSTMTMMIKDDPFSNEIVTGTPKEDFERAFKKLDLTNTTPMQLGWAMFVRGMSVASKYETEVSIEELQKIIETEKFLRETEIWLASRVLGKEVTENPIVDAVNTVSAKVLEDLINEESPV